MTASHEQSLLLEAFQIAWRRTTQEIMDRAAFWTSMVRCLPDNTIACHKLAVYRAALHYHTHGVFMAEA